jgi:CRP-like cAMP-binding protein/Fe-S-cluster-containing hydrogenase component 2
MRRKIDISCVRNVDGIVEAKIDGNAIKVPAGTTIWEAANINNIRIPVLCHQDERMQETFVDLNPVGVCRVCCVQVSEPDRHDPTKVRPTNVLVPACMRPIEQGMEIRTTGAEVETARRTLVELLMADHPSDCKRHGAKDGDCELKRLADGLAIKTNAFPARPRTEVEAAKHGQFKSGLDESRAMIRVDHASCVLCDRCVRACTDYQGHRVIGRVGKGHTTTIGFDLDQPMGESSCVNCGECMVSCPTGALTFRPLSKPIEEALDSPIPAVNDLLKIEIFKGMSRNFLEMMHGNILVHRFGKGEKICEQGSREETAFYINSGECDIYIQAGPPAKARRKRLFPLNLFARHSNGSAAQAKGIVVDAPVDLYQDREDKGKWVNRLKPGELVGEMACLNHQPRSATVTAAVDGVEVLELPRSILERLRRNKAFREQMDKQYRERALHGHMREIDLFHDLDDAILAELENRAELLRVEPGPNERIFAQGDLADAFYVVRCGHIRVHIAGPDGTSNVTYLRRGEFFGEMGVLGRIGLLPPGTGGADGRRTASCEAMDHVDLLKFSSDVLDDLIKRHPEVGDKLKTIAMRRSAENLAATRAAEVGRSQPGTAQAAHSAELRKQFIDQGIYQGQSLLILDLERCTRCDECVRACADAHGGLSRMVRDGIRVDKYLVAVSCRACHDPKCMSNCPVGSIRRDRGLAVVIEDWCIGCGQCAQNCPYGSISMHPVATGEFGGQTTRPVVNTEPVGPAATGDPVKDLVAQFRAVNCDLSRELPEPACVYACPHNAAERINAQDLFNRLTSGS